MAAFGRRRSIPLFVTDVPRIRFNHSVLAFDGRVEGSEAVDFVV